MGRGRARRVDVGGLIYQVLNRANFRSRLFKEPAHYQDFLVIVEGRRVRNMGGRVSAEGCQVPLFSGVGITPKPLPLKPKPENQ